MITKLPPKLYYKPVHYIIFDTTKFNLKIFIYTKHEHDVISKEKL